jgi:hypothetical protein
MLVFTVVISSLLVVTILALTVFDRGAQGQQKAPKKYSEIPQIISNVPDLEVTRSNLKDEGTANAIVKITIRNNSDKPIIGISVESGDEKDASGINLNGIHDGDVTPTIILPPHESMEAEFPISSVHAGRPIRVAGALYADGTDDGDPKVVESMRSQKEYRRSKKTEVLKR